MAKQAKRKNQNTHSLASELKKDDFRVTIFGSARIQKGDEIYKRVFNLAKKIGHHGFDIVTGGGPGMMEAANAGHHSGDPNHHADSIGLTIKLTTENKGNKHLEIKKHFNKFSKRLDNFMALSNVVVITPGGIGTCLELFYTWQLIQVKHVQPIPIILYGEMWTELIKWVKKYSLRDGLISKSDLDWIHIAKSQTQVMKIILKEHEKYLEYKSTHKNGNSHKYNPA
ncbi:LOG family protein [Candidatus Peregrinibacteria bacterium]|nr:LOG family protein [Candidatus Peregrinibacteria bacterium]